MKVTPSKLNGLPVAGVSGPQEQPEPSSASAETGAELVAVR